MWHVTCEEAVQPTLQLPVIHEGAFNVQKYTFKSTGRLDPSYKDKFQKDTILRLVANSAVTSTPEK